MNSFNQAADFLSSNNSDSTNLDNSVLSTKTKLDLNKLKSPMPYDLNDSAHDESLFQTEQGASCILNVPESSFESLREGLMVQTHRPEIFTDDGEFTLQTFQLSLRRLEQAFPPLSARSRSLVEPNRSSAAFNHPFSSLPPSAPPTGLNQQPTNEPILLPSQANNLTSLETLCLKNCMRKIKQLPNQQFSSNDKRLIAHTLALIDCFVYCYFYNFQNLSNSGRHSSGKHLPISNSDLAMSSLQTHEDDFEKRFIETLTLMSQHSPFGNVSLDTSANMGNTPLTTQSSSHSLLSSQKILRSQSIPGPKKPFIMVQLVIFPFERSHIFDMEKDQRLKPYTLFRTGLFIGDWFLEWSESSLVVPTLSCRHRINPLSNLVQLCK